MAINLNGTGSISGLSSISSPAISGVPTGSASAPAFSFTGDTNTGIYSPGADQVAVATSGAGRLFIDSSGNVGVGGSASTNILECRSSTNSTIGITRTGSHNVTLNAVAGGAFTIGVDASGGTTERLRITSAGLVGVGNSSPSNDLDVLKTAAGSTTTARIGATATTGANNATLILNNGGSGNATLRFDYESSTNRASIGVLSSDQKLTFGTAGSTAMTIDASQRVGIGTAVPGELLSVNSSPSNAAISIRTGGASFNSVVKFNADDTNYAGIGLENTALVMRCSNSSTPTERARIDSSGRLLVGTTSSFGSYLTQIAYTGASTNGLYVRSTSSSGDGSMLLQLERASTPNNTVPAIYYADQTAARFELRNNGGLANYQANNVNLSDRNSKKDIAPVVGTWDCIKEWEIVNYRYKDQPDDAALNLGVIAQQVAEICPEVITVFQEAKEATEDKPAQEERLGVKEQQMYWMAIKALQEAQVRIETLEAEVAALKAQ